MDFDKLVQELVRENTENHDDSDGKNIVLQILSFIDSYKGKQIAIFLHTSVMMIQKHNLEILKKAASAKVKFYIPENCVKELKLLANYSSRTVLRKKAQNLLNIFGGSVSWSHYAMTEKKRAIPTYYGYDKALFVFCEPAAASEFSKRFYFGNQNYILSYDMYFGNRATNVYTEIGNIARRCTPTVNIPILQKLKKDDMLSIRDIKGNEIKKIKKESLKDIAGGFGGEAYIYNTPALPGKLIKIYKKKRPCEQMEAKIKLLSMMFYSNNFECCSFPSGLVYCNDACVGFVMDKVEGVKLGKVIDGCVEEKNEKKKKSLLINLSVSLLEARINQIIVADLSPRNAIVKKDGRVVFIDVDSMEFGRFPGGSVTHPYGHPDFEYSRDAYKRLRTLEETNFAYTVLLFWLWVGQPEPLCQGGPMGTEFDWSTHQFPLTNSSILGRGCVVKGLEVSDDYLDAWKKQPYAVRTGFVDIFANHKTYDIGEWLKILNLI